MISTYSEYIHKYVARRVKGAPPSPGEHHFVAAYLVPKLFSINGVVPDYINPDGTKGIIGDVVYYKDDKHHLGIEVKLGVIRLTKGEFNSWVVGKDQSKWPSLFLGVGRRGVALASWPDFRAAYTAAVSSKNSGWSPDALESGYGPMKTVDELASHLPEHNWFALAEKALWCEHEERFSSALKASVEA